MQIEQVASEERLRSIYLDLVHTLRDFVRRHRITEPEYRAALEFIGEMARIPYEIPLWFDLVIGRVVDDITHEEYNRLGGTASNILGPYYLEGAPERSRPYRLGREDEPGEVLFVSGRVLDATTGAPLAGALLDVWQAAANGLYDHQDPQQPPFNMRGKFRTDEEGRYEFRTVIPGNYTIPHDGPTGRFLTVLGQHYWRPKHIHFKVTHEGYQPLVTQLYLGSDDPYLATDVAAATKDELVVDPVRHDDPAELAQRGLDRPFYTATFDIRLVPAQVMAKT
jgi:catechol 1,2-dioxygenase